MPYCTMHFTSKRGSKTASNPYSTAHREDVCITIWALLTQRHTNKKGSRHSWGYRWGKVEIILGNINALDDKSALSSKIMCNKTLSCPLKINEHSAFYEWRCQICIAGSPCTSAYLIDSREERHKLAEHSCTDTGYVNKGTLKYKNSTI